MLQRYSLALAVLIASVISLLLPTSSLASTFYVSTTGANTNAGTQAAPWRTIQYAITTSATTHGDRIIVEHGVYTERLTFSSKHVTVASRQALDNDNSHIALTIIDGSYGGSVVTITTDITLQGLTLRHGGNVSDGGGISVVGANPILTRLVVKDNWSSSGGGGISISNSAALISNTTVVDNTSAYGGGIYIDGSPAPQLSNVTVHSNSAMAEGGGIYSANSPFLMSNSTISANTCGDNGGGLYTVGAAPVLTNVAVDSNAAGDDGGGIIVSEGSLEFRGGSMSRNRAVYGYGGGINANAGSEAVLVGLNISRNSSRLEGGGIYASDSDILLDSSHVDYNFTTQINSWGGGIYSEESNFYVSTATVSHNTATGGGGGMAIAGSMGGGLPSSGLPPAFGARTPGFHNVTVQGNTATYDGGGVSSVAADILFTNSTISGNSTQNNGGGIYCFEGTLAMTNSTVEDNTADGGGGIYITGSPCSPSITALMLDSTSVVDNYASLWMLGGGGIYSSLVEVYVNGSIVSGNFALGDGGGMYIEQEVGNHCQPATGSLPDAFSGRTRGFVHTIISNNGTSRNGGGAHFHGVTAELLSNCTISDNTAGGDGGGLAMYDSHIVIDTLTVSGNECYAEGGGIYAEATNILATSATITSNTSYGEGAGLYWYESKMMRFMPDAGSQLPPPVQPVGLSNSTISDNSSYANAGGMYVVDILNCRLLNLVLQGNMALDGSGGGIYAQYSNLFIDTLLAVDNIAKDHGGALYLDACGLHLANATVQDNSAGSGSGGGLYWNEDFSGGLLPTAESIPFTLPDPGIFTSTFSGNLASSHGGGAYLDSFNDPVQLSNVTFSANSTGVNGGGLYLMNLPVVLSGITAVQNTAGVAGGGIFIANMGSSDSAWTGLKAVGNSAPLGGGAYFVNLPYQTIDNSLFSGNFASSSNSGCEGGGGFVADYSNLLWRNATITGNRAAAEGDGVLVASSGGVFFVNSILWNNGSADTSDVYTCTGETFIAFNSILDEPTIYWTTTEQNTIQCDPQFVMAVNPGDAPTTTGNLHLQNTSPAIGAAVFSMVPDTVEVQVGLAIDIEGNPRGVIADLGAYENALDIPQSMIIAHDDEVVSCEGEQVCIEVLDNDTSAAGGCLTILDYTQGTNGTVCLHHGKLKYQPNDGFFGVDTFTYRVTTSSCSVASTATVTVVISGVGMYAVNLDGDDDYVSVPSGAWFNGDFSVEALVYVKDSGDWTRLMDFGNGQESDNVICALSDGVSGVPFLEIFNGSGGETLYAPDPLPTGQWVHLAFVLDSNIAKIYKNGELWTSDAMAIAPMGAITANNFIGRSNWVSNDYADALFSEFRVWNTARSQEQIQQGMTSRLSGTEEGLVLYYPFDDMGTATAHDATGNNNDGTFENGAVWEYGDIVLQGPAEVKTTTTTTWTYSTFPLDGVSYSWCVSGGSIVSGATTNSVQIAWNDVAEGSVKVTVSNEYGCEMDESMDVRIFAAGPIYYVCTTTGSDCSGTGSINNPFETIEYGIEVATTGQVVLVCPGTYYENIRIEENITVASWHYTTGDTNYIAQTIIDGDCDASAVSFSSECETLTTSATLTGFTVQHGDDYYGGGVDVDGGAPTLSYLVVRNNKAEYGGGIAISYPEDGMSPILSNVTVYGNSAYYGGGGIYTEGATPQFTNIEAYNNSAGNNGGAGFGGGIYISNLDGKVLPAADCPPEVSAPVLLSNVTVHNNSCFGLGGGIYLEYVESVTASNIHVYSNSALVAGGGIAMMGSSAAFDMLVVTGNTVTDLGLAEIAGGGGLWVVDDFLMGSMPQAALPSARLMDAPLQISINNATISGNYGGYQAGGVLVLAGDFLSGPTLPEEEPEISSLQMRMSNSTVSNNEAELGAGGIAVFGADTYLDGVVIRNNTAEVAGGIALIANPLDNTIQVNNCIIDSNSASDGPGGGVYLTGYGPAMPEAAAEEEEEDPTRIVFSGTTITHNTASMGGGFYGLGTFAKLVNTAVQYNEADEDGGGLLFSNALIQLDSCTISHNSGEDGGGIHGSNGVMMMTTSAIDSNYASEDGGGVALSSAGINLTASTVSNNSSGQRGGGIYVFNGGATLAASTVSGNSANEMGGGIGMINSGADLATSTISNNSANGHGGGIYAEGGSITADSSAILQNTTVYSGGGMYADNATISMSNSTANENSAGNHGGGMYLNFASLDMAHSQVRGNTGVCGGGIVMAAGSTGDIKNTVVSGNSSTSADTSSYCGGGVVINDSSSTPVVIVNSTITGNKSNSPGSGLRVGDNARVLMSNTIVSGNQNAHDIHKSSTAYLSAAHSIVGLGSAPDESINVAHCEPMFVAPVIAAAPTTEGNFHVQDISPAVGRGVQSILLANSTAWETTVSATASDIEGLGRGTTPDIGAYENALDAQVTTFTAVDDTAQTCINTPVNVAVMSNDTGADIGVVNYSQGTSGSVTLDSGVLIYTPNAGFAGADSFTYAVNVDGCKAASSATVYLTVHEFPIAVITGINELFAGEQIAYSVVTGASVFVSHEWSADGGTILSDSTAPEVTIRWNTSGTVVTTGVVHLTATDNKGCVTTATFDVLVKPFIPVVIEGDDETVGDTTGVYSTGGVDTTGTRFAWTISEGGTIVGSTTNATVTVEWEDVDEPTTGTITVEIVTPGGGVGSTTFTVTIYPRPILTMTGNTDPCSGAIEMYSASDARNTGSILEWSVQGGTIIGTSTGASILVQWNTTTSVTSASVMVIGQEPHDFDGVTTAAITIHPNPAITVAGSTNTCSGAIHTYAAHDANGTGSSYNWTVSGGTIIGSAMLSNVTVQWNTTNSGSSGSLEVVSVSPQGCSSTIATAVQINPNPILTMSGSTNACSGAVHSYSVSDANTTGSSYNWTVSGGTIIGSPMLSNVTVQWNTVNSQLNGMVTVVATTPSGCTATSATAVEINPNPILTMSGSTNACSDAIHSYSVSDANATGSSYNWTVNGGTIIGSAVSSTLTVQWNTTNSKSNGSVTVIATTPSGCTATSATAVQINPNPILTMSGSTNACSDAVHTYSVSDANATGSSYNWTVNGGTIIGSAVSNTLTVQWNTASSKSNGSVTVIATTPSGCTATSATAVQINPNPILTMSGSTNACSGAVHSYSVSDANTTGSSYNWTVSGGTIIGSAVSNTLTVEWNTVSSQLNGSVTVIATTPSGCTATSATAVQINPNPVLTIKGTGSTCAGLTGEYSVSDANATGSSYNWTVSGGAIISGQGTETLLIQWGAATNATIGITATTPMGCNGVSTMPVAVNANPIPDIAGSRSFCAAGSTVLDAGTGFSSYLWSNGATTHTITVTVAGLYSVTVSNAAGCVASTSASIIELPPVFSNAGTDITICTGATVQLDGRGTSFIGDMVFKWSPTTGLSNPNIADPIASPITTTVYTLTVTDGFGCSAIDEVVVTVMPAMTVSASGDGLICRGNSAQLQATGGVSYSWSPAAGLSNTSIANPVASPVVTTLYTVTITNANGCTTTASVTVTVSAPVADAGQSVSICAGGSTQLQATGGVSYSWSPAQGLDNPNSATPVASPSATTTYTVTATNALGCSSVATVTVTVDPLNLEVTALLEGAYNNGALRTELASQGLVPTAQPYNTAPFNYTGSEVMTATSPQVVDWVLLELRTMTSPGSVAARRAALLMNDGRVVDTDGTSTVSFPALTPSPSGYYIVVRHRNHVSMMSAVQATSNGGCKVVYDFSASASAAYADFMAGQAMLDSTHFGMWTGDINQDGIVNAVDRVGVRNDNGLLGYRTTDLSLDGIVNALDRVIVRNNTLVVTQVP